MVNFIYYLLFFLLLVGDIMINDVMQIGDKITVNIPDENWEWGYKPVAKQRGTLAEIIGFGEVHYSRTDSYGKKPGVYVNRYWVNIRTEDGKEYSEFSGRLEMVNQQEYQRRVDEWREKGGANAREEEFIRELPETKFWEDDKVLVFGTSKVVSVDALNASQEDFEKIQSGEKPESYLTIVCIEYGWRSDNNVWTYRVSDKFGAGWHTYAHEPELVLMERGNFWKHAHGEPLQFENLKEEMMFFSMLGHKEYIKNPNTDDYEWTKDEVLEAIKNGSVDGFSIGRLLFSGNQKIDAVRFTDRDLGERVRQATMEGFGIQ